jgi:hypothetical protein
VSTEHGSGSSRSWAIRHPLLMTWWLEATAALRQHIWLTSIVLVAPLAGSSVMAVRFGPELFKLMQGYPVAIDTMVALLASVLTHLSRHHLEAQYSSGWLSSLPVSRRELTLTIGLRSILVPVAMVVLLIGVALVVRVCVPDANTVTAPLIAGMSAGTLLGALMGWFVPPRSSDRTAPTLLNAATPRSSAVASLAALSRWTSLQAKAWLQPRSLARILLPAMLALPMGISGNVAVGLMYVFALLVYLSALLLALRRVIRDGAHWLKPTPLNFRRFAMATLRLPLIQQCQWIVTAAIVLVVLGITPLLAARAAELWLALVTVISGTALSQVRAGGSMRVNLLLAVCALGIVERLKAFLALPCALLISAWHLRKAVRT